jgi:hypothetical protein
MIVASIILRHATDGTLQAVAETALLLKENNAKAKD